jgi:hypothetical protein
VTLRNSVVPAAFALAGCLSSESEAPAAFEQATYETPMQGGDCEVEHVDYHIHATLTHSGVFAKSAGAGTLLVTVAESQSVVDCRADIVRIATPGAELATHATRGDSFSLEVPNVIIGGQRPSIWVGAVLDTNDNGECDPGELSGSVEVEDTELGDLAIALSDEACPHRS